MRAAEFPDDEKLLLDTDPAILNDPSFSPILTRLNELHKSCNHRERPQPALVHGAWRFGLQFCRNTKYKNKILLNNRKGWTITANKNIQCKGVTQNYRVRPSHLREGVKSLIKRIERGYIWGPFTKDQELPPILQGSIYWPYFFKQEQIDIDLYKIRTLIDFSNDSLDQGFNDNLTEKEKTVSYLKLKEILFTIIQADLRWMWAMDAMEAYYRVPIKDEFLRYMGIQVMGYRFFFTCLVMGMASGCRLYTEFADTVQAMIIANNRDLFVDYMTKTILLLHYIDDFAGGHRTKIGAKAQFERVLWWWDFLGIPTQLRKTTKPTQFLIFIGYLFNLKDYTLSIKPLRMKRYRKSLDTLKVYYHRKQPMRIR